MGGRGVSGARAARMQHHYGNFFSLMVDSADATSLWHFRGTDSADATSLWHFRDSADATSLWHFRGTTLWEKKLPSSPYPLPTLLHTGHSFCEDYPLLPHTGHSFCEDYPLLPYPRVASSINGASLLPDSPL